MEIQLSVTGREITALEKLTYGLAEVSVNIIDQCVMQGVPLAREYGGLLDAGGTLVARTFMPKDKQDNNITRLILQ
jgi:succinate dehydrogenase / fumarate reductase flavoprotein subunit